MRHLRILSVKKSPVTYSNAPFNLNALTEVKADIWPKIEWLHYMFLLLCNENKK